MSLFKKAVIVKPEPRKLSEYERIAVEMRKFAHYQKKIEQGKLHHELYHQDDINEAREQDARWAGR